VPGPRRSRRPAAPAKSQELERAVSIIELASRRAELVVAPRRGMECAPLNCMAGDGKNGTRRLHIVAPLDAGALTNARASAFPDPLPEPEIATAADGVPGGDAWLYEIKLDGYRLLALATGGHVELVDRYGQAWSLPALERAIGSLAAESVLLDGELVALCPDGTTSFRALQDSLAHGWTAELVYEAFDVLYMNGYDLTEVDLLSRKRALKGLLTAGGAMPNRGRVRYVHHFDGNGAELYDEVCRLGLAGVVCKLRSAPYRGGASADWIEVRATERVDAEPDGLQRRRAAFASRTPPHRQRLVVTATVRERRTRASRPQRRGDD
jgi:ATP-dependent DNA ligase